MKVIVEKDQTSAESVICWVIILFLLLWAIAKTVAQKKNKMSHVHSLSLSCAALTDWVLAPMSCSKLVWVKYTIVDLYPIYQTAANGQNTTNRKYTKSVINKIIPHVMRIKNTHSALLFWKSIPSKKETTNAIRRIFWWGNSKNNRQA